ncbi:MAG TPA: polymer-forming cytoskeletal protein [Mucilaginibacter sp.]|jgi:Integral membrane protein CcmA involved in cell shape determination|uniref:bactofilin family protein n=1 Tax=Mucilaginibacter sp. TaxID=1882438 RepID=UPI002C975C75|nr:polymer-forming cytoskeletal protein [Mucilaginibacter sp.]HTI58693.1 polymer-forming cytoskeletal protein [Mucilaginibacter sp.]
MGVFSKKDKVALDLQAISTLISEGSVVAGNLTAPAVARVDGQVNGDVQVAEGLILGEQGVITGNINTKEMVVYGTVQGNIAVESLEIKGTGKITGDICATTLLVETGGIYNGHLTMQAVGVTQIKQLA